MRRTIVIAGVAAAALLVGLALWWIFWPGGLQPSASNARAQHVENGRYLAVAGNCIGCHTAYGGEAYAGGLPLATPFGTFYAPNITPDAETGIGNWTSDDFWRALHDGRGRNGELLYPAFPYTNYTKVTRADADDMFAYFQSLKPVRRQNRAHELKFPYDQRRLIAAWRALYFKPGEFQPDAAQSEEWNRGAYLVTGLGHCDACHSARNFLGAVAADNDIAGGLIPMQNWYAPPLNSDSETGLGEWHVDQVVELMKTGVSERGAVFGPMSVVVLNSLQHLSVADLRAMAVYVKSIRPAAEQSAPRQFRVSEQQEKALLREGVRLYDRHCRECHGSGGEGVPRIYPPLRANESIVMPFAINPIRMVVNGGFPPSTEGNPRPYGMPPFGHVLNDREIAAVVTYIRGSWGNRAPAVSPAQVANARGAPVY